MSKPLILPSAFFSSLTADSRTPHRRRSQEEILQEYDLSAAVLASLPGIYYMYNADGRFLRWNSQFETVTCYTPDEIATLHPLDLFDEPDRTLVAGRISTVFRAGIAEVEANLRTKDGRHIPYYFNGVLFDIGGQRCALGMGIDISVQRQTLAEWERTSDQLRVSSRMGRLGAWSVALEGLRITWSQELLAILELAPDYQPDFEYGVGMYLPAYQSKIREVFGRCVEAGVPFDEELQCATSSGKVLWVRVMGEAVRDSNGVIVGARGGFQDISEQKRLEMQLRQAQKMEAIGQLAGGVAHDFNNLLTVIKGCTSLLLDSVSEDDPTHELLQDIQQAGERAGTMTRQLLAFSRQQIVAPKVLDLDVVVGDIERMLRRLIGEHIVLITRLEAQPGRIKIDPGQLEQVLMNLVVNARDAMPNGGTITIGTWQTLVDGDGARSIGTEAGDYVVLTVRDTGTGMDEATRLKIFEPFFTTKGVGKGTGLGLATVHGIIRQAGGQIVVSSTLGTGTTFEIYLPRASTPRASAGAVVPKATMPRGTETVLLVEDEDAVRGLARHILSSVGYRVLAASDGEEAVRVATAEPGPIHMLVSDVVMPYLGGRALAERIMATRPRCRVLFLSGYTDDAVLQHGVREEEFAFLRKPFAPAQLAQKVREVLDAV